MDLGGRTGCRAVRTSSPPGAGSEHNPIGHSGGGLVAAAQVAPQRGEPSREIVHSEAAELVGLDRDAAVPVADDHQGPLGRNELADQSPAGAHGGNFHLDRQSRGLEGEHAEILRAAHGTGHNVVQPRVIGERRQVRVHGPPGEAVAARLHDLGGRASVLAMTATSSRHSRSWLSPPVSRPRSALSPSFVTSLASRACFRSHRRELPNHQRRRRVVVCWGSWGCTPPYSRCRRRLARRFASRNAASFAWRRCSRSALAKRLAAAASRAARRWRAVRLQETRATTPTTTATLSHSATGPATRASPAAVASPTEPFQATRSSGSPLSDPPPWHSSTLARSYDSP